MRRLIPITVISMAMSAVGAAAFVSGCSGFGSEEGIGSSSSSSSSGAGGGFAGGVNGTGTGFNEPPSRPPADGSDAGADGGGGAMPFVCDGLDQSKPLVLYLSADDSNSMGSPVISRELLNKGLEPYSSSIRTYEFLNYYRIHYDPAPLGELSLVPQMDTTMEPSELDFQIGVRSFDAPKPRRPMTMTFVLDTSGSMGNGAIDRERAAVKAIAASMAEGDIVNMVTWNTSNNVVLSGHQVSGPNDPKILQLADALAAAGGTDLHSGLVTGYDLAKQHYGPARMNRVILISDGGANVGVTDADLIGVNSKDADKEGIYLVGVGAGPVEGYSDGLMDIVTDKGRGAYIYLDEQEEATRMFVDRFDETMEIAARGVQVEVTLPWYFQMHKFYGEEYSTNPQEVEPQHLAPSDAMIFNQVLKACDPTMINQDDTITVKATWQAPITYENKQAVVTMTVKDLLAADKAQLNKGRAIVAYAEALKDPTKLTSALAIVQAANPGANDPELNEIADLIPKHPKFVP